MICSKCKKTTDRVRTQHVKNVNGQLVSLIPDGQQWCWQCCKGLEDLTTINQERKTNKKKSNGT